MSFAESIRSCFRQYVTFSGRAPRSEYWWFALFLLLGNLLFGMIDGFLFGFSEDSAGLISRIFGLATFLPSIAVAARRLHDVDRSGWWQLAPAGMMGVALIFTAAQIQILAAVAGFGVLVTALVLLYWLIKRGTTGPNRFGADPLDASLLPEPEGEFSRSSIPRVPRD
ncbi:MAG TPA: DUF805 domain-containing protein [Rhodobacteraceae bacterium]|nr:DUF805 domain-containing protein [Paracoccaceae bacterium]